MVFFPDEILIRLNQLWPVLLLSFSHKNRCLFEGRKLKVQPLWAWSSSWHKQSERRQKEVDEEGGVTFSECDPLFTKKLPFCNIFTPHSCLFSLESPLQLLLNPFSLMRTSTATMLLSGLWFIYPSPPVGLCWPVKVISHWERGR